MGKGVDIWYRIGKKKISTLENKPIELHVYYGILSEFGDFWVKNP